MFQQLLEKMALALDGRGIPYMVIGGQAVLLYGEPRLTKDIDVTLGVGAEELGAVLAVAEQLGWSALPDEPEGFVSQTMVLPCLDPASTVRIDFIFSSSVYERHAMDRVRRLQIGRAQVRFVSVEDLIIHKMIAGRPRDLEDVKSVLVKNPSVDSAYILQWLEEFQAALSQPFVKQFQELSEESR